MIYETEEELQEACREWQKCLILNDWEIRPHIVRSREMSDPDSLGECEYNLEKADAAIRILDPSDFVPSLRYPEHDMEKTLVHELLHLHFATIKIEEDSLEYAFMEQAVDKLARSLVRLKRQIPEDTKKKKRSADNV